ncbi:MAG TPA: efflux RND transporter periplasmic adaptor subunit [Lysobacter sp.]|nr:efflux RND transporter periplasmic adaptor subunit [Lysobacter sp.]
MTRLGVAAGLLAALVACGGEVSQSTLPPLPALGTFVVEADGESPGRAWDGVVEAVQQVDISAQTQGRIVAVNVDLDDRVEAGDVLLRLSAVEQQAGVDNARAQLRAAEALAVEADANHRRYAALGDGQFVSRAQIDQARAARDSAAAARDAARAQLDQIGQQAAYTVVRAPFAGVVHARRVEPGESVAPGQPLLSLYAPEALRIRVQVPQSEAAGIVAANRASVVFADGRRVEAAAVSVLPSADPLTHGIGVRITLPPLDEALSPGTTAKVLVPIAGGSEVLWIPSAAVLRRGELTGAYVLVDDRPVLRQLRLGQDSGGRVEVLAGLRPGETVATDPVAALQALMAQRKARGAGHD